MLAMFGKRLRRYTGLLVLIGALIGFIIATLALNIYVSSSTLTTLNIGASRSDTLQHMLQRLGPQDEQVRERVLAHVRLIRDGGELLSYTGSPYQVLPSTDPALGKFSSRVEALYRQNSFADVPAAYDGFVTAYHDFRQRRIGYFQVFQLVAGAIILLGFFAIVFILFFRLGRSDDRVEKTFTENQRILSTIKDGLFLLNADFQIGSVQSTATKSLFAMKNPIKGDFLEFIKPLLSEEVLNDAKEYIGLIMEGHGRRSLLTSLNPLREVQIELQADNAEPTYKYLHFDFSRNVDTIERGILVSVSDITNEVLLRQQLEVANASKQERFQVLLGSLAAEPVELSRFYASANTALKKINDLLRGDTQEHGDNHQKLKTILTKVRAIKSNASALGMSLIETSARSLEGEIELLHASPAVIGNQMLGLTVQLKQMISELDFLQQLTAKVEAVKSIDEPLTIAIAPVDALSMQTVAAAETSSEQNKLKKFAAEVAKRTGKLIHVDVYGLDAAPFKGAVAEEIESLCIQLVRNAVVHGIEDTELRSTLNKSSAGQIIVSLKEKDEDNMALLIRDDGAGLNLKDIRARAIKKGLVSFSDAAGLKAGEIVRFLFKPGFTTRDHADIDGGRGYGLDVVKTSVAGLGGKIGVKSRKGLYCEITIKLPKTLLVNASSNASSNHG